MKKTYVYFLFPLVGLIIFGAIYWNFSSKYDQKQEQILQADKKARQDKKDQAERDRKKAYDDAVAGSERTKQAKAAKEKKDADDAEARQQASDLRFKLQRDSTNLAKKIDALNKDVETAQKEIAGIEDDKKKAKDEQTFLVAYVKQAQDNTNSLQGVLQKIKDADDAAAAAAKAAADAAAAAAKAKK